MIRTIGELKIVHSNEFLVFLSTQKRVITVSGVNGPIQRGIETCSQWSVPIVGRCTDFYKMEHLPPVMIESHQDESTSVALAVPRDLPPRVSAGAVAAQGAEATRPQDPLQEPSAEVVRALDAHFDKVFAALGPRHATASYLRRRLCAELHLHVEQRSHIEGCSVQAACSRAVLAALRMHERFLDNAYQSKKHCVRSKYHYLLYSVAKLCFDCRLQDSEVVCCLLRAIFWCENSLDNLVVGAILGIVSTHVFNGWKSDFESREENLKALDYFLEQAGRGRLRFDPEALFDEADYEDECNRDLKSVGGGGVGGCEETTGGDPHAAALVATQYPTPEDESQPPPMLAPRSAVGLADLPLRAYDMLKPLALAVLLANADAVLLLLRHGARPLDASPLYAWFGKRVAGDNLARCVRVLMRAVRWVDVVRLSPSPDASQAPRVLRALPEDAMAFAEGSPEEALLPASRRRRHSTPPSLKHLSRCGVRAAMRAAGTLPFGLRDLCLPPTLREYLDLLED